jgi:hypothetical protein
MTEFTVSATMLQRPIARTKPVLEVVIATRLYHSRPIPG